jgi:4-alpha-glucanotransferase
MAERCSGMLVHPTSFPGKYGCGDLGEGARQIIDLLKECGQKYLQVLPLGPTGFGDAPYSNISVFAGNPYIISFEELLKQGYLDKKDFWDYPDFLADRVDYYGLFLNVFHVLRRAFEKFRSRDIPDDYYEFDSVNSFWLDDYAMFMSLKDHYQGKSWDKWEEKYRDRLDLDHIPEDIEEGLLFHKFLQWIFYRQWNDFRKYAKSKGISIIGTATYFCNYDSADVWANRNLFNLNKKGRMTMVAGVPADFFSAKGQLWGNPIYNWSEMKKDNYHWWYQRINHLTNRTDKVILDHFRGFDSVWTVKPSAKNAAKGTWVTGPGSDFFASIQEQISCNLTDCLIADDLGLVSDEVTRLRDSFGFSGMKVFQFADFLNLENPDNPNLPEQYVDSTFAYPGTHDNDMLIGWYASQPSGKQRAIRDYLGIDSIRELNSAVIEKMLASEAGTVIMLLQDVLELASDSRLNTPGTCGVHNWTWRITQQVLEVNSDTIERLKKIMKKTGRK